MVNNQLPERFLVPAVCSLLLLAVALVFGQTVRHDFVNFDDDLYVYENPRVALGLTGRGLAWAFTRSHAGNWHPLTWLSHMLDCQLYGLWAGGHHLTNVLLHAAAAILLFLALRRMTGRLWPCAFVAALFAIHPLHVESVAWVAERKDVLSGLFFMLTLLVYAEYTRRPFALGRYLTVLAMFALGLMAKPMLVTLPCVLLLLDHWPLARISDAASLRRVLLEKVPLFLLSVATCLVTVWVDTVQPLAAISMMSRIGNALVSYVTYIVQMFYPANLAVLYPHPGEGLPLWKVAGAALLLTGLTLGALLGWRRRPWLTVGWLWYLGMLAPVIGIVQVGDQAMADRYTYLPQIGLYMALAWEAVRFAGASAARRRLCWAAAVMAIAASGCLAWRQTSYWKDSATLWARALACTTGNSLAHNNLGFALAGLGKTEEAIRHYQEALRLNPKYALAHNNWGFALAGLGKTEEAIRHYQEALRFNPKFVLASYNWGNLLNNQGRFEEAIPHYGEVLRINPHDPMAHNNWGFALAGLGKTEEAIRHYQEALRLDPDCTRALYNWGNLLKNQGRFKEAIPHYADVLRINPRDPMAHSNWGLALAGQGKMDEAIVHYREALRLDPRLAVTSRNLAVALTAQGELDEAIRCYQQAEGTHLADADAHSNFGGALAIQGNPDLAIRHFERALQLRPDFAEAHFNLGSALVSQGRLDEAIRHYQAFVRLSPGNLRGFRQLAAAYAEVGRFPEAAATAREAADLAATQGDEEQAARIEKRIKAYQAGQPYRER